jgi:hypothetical protein
VTFATIAPIAVSSAAAAVSASAAYIAWSSGRRTRKVTVNVASTQDKLKSFDSETEDLEKKFNYWNGDLGDSAHLAGHLSARTIAARLQGEQARLAGLLEQMATPHSTTAEIPPPKGKLDLKESLEAFEHSEVMAQHLKQAVEEVGALAADLLSSAIDAEREGRYRRGFFDDALHPDSEWTQKQLELRQRQVDCYRWFDHLMRVRRRERQTIEAQFSSAK